MVSYVSLSLSHWYLGQVWYLIVSIPDLCNLTYFRRIFSMFFPSYKSMGALCFPLPDESLQEISSLSATDIRDILY